VAVLVGVLAWLVRQRRTESWWQRAAAACEEGRALLGSLPPAGALAGLDRGAVHARAERFGGRLATLATDAPDDRARSAVDTAHAALANFLAALSFEDGVRTGVPTATPAQLAEADELVGARARVLASTVADLERVVRSAPR
jgi:hypothetical protein